MVLRGEALGALGSLPGQIALPPGEATPWLVGIGVALVAAVLLLATVLALHRRRERQDLRSIAVAVEDLRSGGPARRPGVDPRSPAAFVADAVDRLGRELAGMRLEARGAGERLEAFLGAAIDQAVVTTDLDGEIRSFSAGARAMLGWSEEEAVGREASALFEDQAWRDLLPLLSRRGFRERGVETRTRLLRRDGTALDAQLTVRLLAANGNRPTGFLLLARDVSEQVRLEQGLRESEARYRGLLEGIDEAVFIARRGRVVWTNPAFADLCGVSSEEIEGRPLRDHVATRDVLIVDETLAALEGRPAKHRELLVTLLDGRGRPWREVRLRAAGFEQAGEPAVLGSLRDETAARAVERRLRDNEARLDAVVESLPDGILVIADTPSGGLVRMTNRAFCDLLGLGTREILGASETEVLRRLRERGGGAEAVAAVLAAATAGPVREPVSLAGPPSRALEALAAPLGAGGGERLGRVLVCRDLTRERASEEQVRSELEVLRASREALEMSHRELGAAQQTLERRALEQEQLNRELRRLDEMKSSLLSNVSHELQTPLVSIRGYTEMILKERLGAINEEQRKGLGLSLKNIDRLISMIDSLVAFSRMDREAATLDLRTFRLRPLVEESVELMRARLEERRIAPASTFEDPEVAIHADRDKIQQVFLNLLANAVKFNRDGGRIEIRVRSGRPGFVQVEIRDTGIGIPAADLERIFDRHYRVGSASGRAPEGSGLGLAIVRNILRLHGCAIRADSREGEGSSFSFTLPLAREGAGEVAVPPAPPPSGTPGAAAGRRDPASDRPKPRFRIIRNHGSGD